jgi:peptidyl-tRNA hydrolase, PTH1 family
MLVPVRSFIGCFWRRPGERRPSSAGLLVFGIGNPGFRFANTRHNVGFRVIDRLAGALGGKKRGRTDGAAVSFAPCAGKTVALVKPMTYVNRCGGAFRTLSETYALPLDSCLVVVDDYNLPLGTLRIRKAGSDGGHNGLASIIAAVGEGFPRLRVGIGPLPEGGDAVAFVLGKFTKEERRVVDGVIETAAEAVRVFCADGIDKTMSLYNGAARSGEAR